MTLRDTPGEMKQGKEPENVLAENLIDVLDWNVVQLCNTKLILHIPWLQVKPTRLGIKRLPGESQESPASSRRLRAGPS